MCRGVTKVIGCEENEMACVGARLGASGGLECKVYGVTKCSGVSS